MHLGDIVIYGGQRFHVRGVDPVGACPRYLYLENVQTGETLSVAFERNRPPRENSAGGLHLVQDDPSPSSTHGDPLEEGCEPKPSDSNRPSPA
jgi:hypothetical protein